MHNERVTALAVTDLFVRVDSKEKHFKIWDRESFVLIMDLLDHTMVLVIE